MIRWRQLVASAALALMATVLTLGALEVALRVHAGLQPVKPPPKPKGLFWKRHPEIGWVHPQAYEAPWYDDRGEFSVTVRINSKGLRDVEHEYDKPPGIYRILLIGDSYLEALQVQLDETFGRLLEQQLNTEGRKVEVINTGVADWGTDNQLEYFRVEGVKYDPDLVVLAFTTANDVRNNYPALNRAVPKPNLHKPTFTLAADGSLELHPPPPDKPPPPRPPMPPPPWWRRLRIVTLVTDRLRPAPPAAPPSVPAPARKVPTDMLVYAPNYTDDVKEAWRVTKALVGRLREEAEASGANFAVVLVNGPWAHYDEPWNRMLIGSREAQQTWLRRRPNAEMGAFLSSAQIPSLDLMEPFEAVKEKERLFFKIDPHWTPAGHRVAAEAVADFLARERLVPDPQP